MLRIDADPDTDYVSDTGADPGTDSVGTLSKAMAKAGPTKTAMRDDEPICWLRATATRTATLIPKAPSMIRALRSRPLLVSLLNLRCPIGSRCSLMQVDALRDALSGAIALRPYACNLVSWRKDQ